MPALEAHDPAPAVVDRLVGLGWAEPVAALFDEHAELGRVPGRVVAIHRETSIVATREGDLTASVTGRMRFECPRKSPRV